ncbi:MAG TPA: hypothetical protein VN174_04260 [Candidatus Methanoperedens sp.]|nr:hypothetical protein [Candidatus Methanoperedens sp.]
MKKKSKKVVTPYTHRDFLAGGLIIFFSLLILSALAYWKISPVTYREFDTTCQHFSYNDCMRWFYNTKPYFTKLAIGSLIFALLTLISTLIIYFKKITINFKCCGLKFILK